MFTRRRGLDLLFGYEATIIRAMIDCLPEKRAMLLQQQVDAITRVYRYVEARIVVFTLAKHTSPLYAADESVPDCLITVHTNHGWFCNLELTADGDLHSLHFSKEPSHIQKLNVKIERFVVEPTDKYHNIAAEIDAEHHGPDVPVFPIRIVFNDGDEWIVEDITEVGCNLEFCDTRDEDDVEIYDDFGRELIVVVDGMEIKEFKLAPENEK